MTTSWIVVFVLLPLCLCTQFEYKLEGDDQKIGNLSYKNSESIWLHVWYLGNFQGSYEVNKKNPKISSDLNTWLANASIVVFPNFKSSNNDLVNLTQLVSEKKELVAIFFEWSVDQHGIIRRNSKPQRHLLQNILNQTHHLLDSINKILDTSNIQECWGQGIGAMLCMKTQDYQVSNYSRIVAFDISQKELKDNTDLITTEYTSELTRSEYITNLVKICHDSCTENEIKLNQNSKKENYSVSLTFWASLVNGTFAILSKKGGDAKIDYQVQKINSSWESQVTKQGVPNHGFSKGNGNVVSCEFKSGTNVYCSFVCYYRVCYIIKKKMTTPKTKLELKCNKQNVSFNNKFDFGKINISSRFTNKSNTWKESNHSGLMPTSSTQSVLIKTTVSPTVISTSNIVSTTFTSTKTLTKKSTNILTSDSISTSDSTQSSESVTTVTNTITDFNLTTTESKPTVAKNSTVTNSFLNHFNSYVSFIIFITVFIILIVLILLCKFWNDCCLQVCPCVTLRKLCVQKISNPINEKCEDLKDIVAYSCYDFSTNWKVEDPEFQNMLNRAKQQYPELYDSRYRIVSEIDRV